MCVIAISNKGNRQPEKNELLAMWNHNPDGAGYMYAKNGRVIIHKGFTTFADFYRSVNAERFTKATPVIYHFRISTQAGRTPFMTHPFPVTSELQACEYLDCTADIAVAHNGIIPITTDRNETRYSDTALFVSKYLSVLVRSADDLKNQHVKDIIQQFGGFSRFAFMDSTGNITTIGDFTEHNGILLSNENHLNVKPYPFTIPFSYANIYRR